MRHITEYKTFEADIMAKGKKLYVGDKRVRDMSPKELDDNLIFVHLKEGFGFLKPPGAFWVYFVDTSDWGQKLKKNEYDMLMFPVRRRFDWNAAPIKDVWKKSHTKNYRGADHIMGMVEGIIDDDKKEIVVEMMSVRSPAKRNRINSIMLTALKEHLPDYKFVWQDPTDDGLAFIKHFDENPKFEWTFAHRPKTWPILFPEETTKKGE